MSDIVERLRNCFEYHESALIGVTNEAADEIESLRQRVEELEVVAISRLREQVIKDFAQIDRNEEELAARKGITAFNPNNAVSNVQSGILKQSQGEPVAWMYVADGFSTAWSKDRIPKENLFGKPVEIPLYTTPTIPEGWQIVTTERMKELEEYEFMYKSVSK